MSDPLDFKSAHDKKHGPDPQFIYRDEKGVKWFTFAARYQDGDAEFGFWFWALDMADAERRLDLIRSTVKLDDQLHSEIPA